MTNSTRTVRTVTARDLREFANADPKRLARLSPEARKTVERDANGNLPKGRVHPEAQEDHNKHRRTSVYFPGASRLAAEAAAEDAAATRAAARAAGVSVGARGPLPKTAKVTLGLSKG